MPPGGGGGSGRDSAGTTSKSPAPPDSHICAAAELSGGSREEEPSGHRADTCPQERSNMPYVRSAGVSETQLRSGARQLRKPPGMILCP